MKKEKILRNLKNTHIRENEDIPIIDFLNKLDKSIEYKLLEVGSGLCRFVDKISINYPNISITCLEINPDLADLAKNKGFSVINENILYNTLKSNEYDIVHCSHVIEHFSYPDVIKLIDELIRVTKIKSYLIIRSPLMSDFFYNDIDHIRPYPPHAIINYLNNEEQQIKGSNKIEIIGRWNRTAPKQYELIDRSSYLYIVPFRKFLNKKIEWLNKRLEIFWNKYRYPASKPTGYVLILKKIS